MGERERDAMQNVEYKAELRDHELAHAIARSIGARHVAQLWQVDTYFRLAHGRLKRRETEGYPPEFIHYHRSDTSRARVSDFTIYTENQAFERFGSLPIDPWVIVRKVRDVYLLGHIRIHLDQVERLGHFVEFEALVLPSHALSACHEGVERLRQAFAPVLGEPLSLSYSDLLAMEPELPPAAEPPV
ncbi:MAG: class IV adenylate cyclase [Phycisphaerales bacterium]